MAVQVTLPGLSAGQCPTVRRSACTTRPAGARTRTFNRRQIQKATPEGGFLLSQLLVAMLP